MKILTIENRKGKLALNSPVHKESADELIEELGRLYGPSAVAAQMRIGEIVCAADDALESIEVEINSPGGSVFEGQRIFNALREMSSRGVEIVATVSGIAASMGSVILMAGDQRRMTKGSRVMIHEASTMAYGDARELRKNADLLEGISAEIAGIYAERTGGDVAEIRNLMLAETWMDADKAKELGFIDQILTFKKSGAKAEASDLVDIRPVDRTKPDMNILKMIFPDKDAEISVVESALAEVDALRVEAETLKAEISGKDQSIAEHLASIGTLNESITELSATLAAAENLANENAQTIADLQAKVDEAAQSAGTQATQMLAAIGQQEPLAIVPSETAPQDVLAQYEAMPEGAAKRQFLSENAVEIRRLAIEKSAKNP